MRRRLTPALAVINEAPRTVVALPLECVVTDVKKEQSAAEAPKHVPNHIELDKRATYLALSALIIFYAAASLARDDFYVWLPSRRGRDISEHLHGAAAWLAALATFSAAANMLSVVVDHYDRRNNETNYRAFAKWSLRSAVALLVLAMMVHAVTKGGGTQ